MAVLQIIDTIDLGGAQTVVKGIMDRQTTNKNLNLFALRSKDITINIQHENFYLHKGDAKYSFAALKELRHLITEKKITTLHCHLFKSQVFGYLLKRFYFPNIKLIFHEHGQIFGTSPTENFVFKNFIKLAKHKVDCFIAVSKATKQLLQSKTNVKPSKIDVLYNFVDLAKYNFNEKDSLRITKRKELSLTDNEIVIGFAGRLDTIKGLKYLLAALPKLTFNYKVVLAGEGPIRTDLENQVKQLNLSDKVIFLGFQKNMPSVYPAFDIYAMPSLSEASPMTFYEAQAFGKPVVGSNVSAINEFVKPNVNGLLFEVKNENDLATKLNKLGKNPDTISGLSQNSINGIKQYSLTAFISNLNSIYSARGFK